MKTEEDITTLAPKSHDTAPPPFASPTSSTTTMSSFTNSIHPIAEEVESDNDDFSQETQENPGDNSDTEMTDESMPSEPAPGAMDIVSPPQSTSPMTPSLVVRKAMELLSPKANPPPSTPAPPPPTPSPPGPPPPPPTQSTFNTKSVMCLNDVLSLERSLDQLHNSRVLVTQLYCEKR